MRRWTLPTLVGAGLVAGCAGVKPPPAMEEARCAATAVRLLEPAPLFTGPGPTAALDRALQPGQAIMLCGAQGQRQQVLLPRPGKRCTGAADCSAGWIPRGTRTEPAR